MLNGGAKWHEVLDQDNKPREQYAPLLHRLLKGTDSKDLDERLDATLREVGISFELPSLDRKNTWFCDLLPQIFEREEWDLVSDGFRQRVRAFEYFLADVYGKRNILRDHVLPLQMVLASPQYQRSAVGLRPTRDLYLHLPGLCFYRDGSGKLVIKNHYFGHASGLSYMIQDRRLLARVVPDLFREHSVESIADVPTEILVRLREVANRPGPNVVLLTPGVASAVYSEHSFLARRMGIPLVQGKDLVVLESALYLKTVAGLEQVDVVYCRIADPWLDPLVLRSDSRLGVPGLISCLRAGTVAIINSVGAQLADDRSLLHFSNAIIRYYLGEWPLLETVQTYWLGDLDQREMVLENLDRFQVRGLIGERFLNTQQTEAGWAEVRAEVRRMPHLYVAQPLLDTAETLCVVRGKSSPRLQDHIVYGVRQENRFEVFPGALTRVSATEVSRTESEHGGGAKDTWIMREAEVNEFSTRLSRRLGPLPDRQVTSRVAEAFYWLGRYLERALTVSKILLVVETVEMEELTATERKLYRPVWNYLLPPLERAHRGGRRSMSNASDRYRLMLDGADLASVQSMIRMAFNNGGHLRDVISPEAWGVLATLHTQFQRNRFRAETSESEAVRVTRRFAESANALIAQFFSTAQDTMLADDGWRFCVLGQYVERASTTANATCGLAYSWGRRKPMTGSIEIELSAFLRMLGCRDAYRRIYQTRSDAPAVLEFLWQNRDMPRSVTFCLERCAELLRASIPGSSPTARVALDLLEDLTAKIRRVDWRDFFADSEENWDAFQHTNDLLELLGTLLGRTGEVHHTIADTFLNHQQIITEPEPTLL